MKSNFDKGIDILKKKKMGAVASIVRGLPLNRYMTFYSEGYNLYTLTSRQTAKVEELEKNPEVTILFGHEALFNHEYLEYRGKVSFSSDKKIIDEMWSPSMAKWFTGKDDPDILVLAIEPVKVSLLAFNRRDAFDIDFTLPMPACVSG